MANPEWLNVKRLFDAAVERDPGERDAFLVEACGSDEQLLAEVRSLLAYEGRDRDFLHPPSRSPLLDVAEALNIGADPRIDSLVGHYRIKQSIASGGMGTVYLAERDDRSYEKKVALKVIKRGMDTDDILRRFRTERQVLANLEHPSICRLIDGGATDDGVPYLVMEYVDGAPIDQHCDERQLPIVDRLRLFQTVCDAVQYAHQNLVVHRDLKPNNILVTADDQPKLLDFGIAKVLDPSQSDRTAQDSPMFTPRYASPEQVRGEPVSVSSDVYALGVILYELLTGHRPYQFTTHTFAEFESVICEQNPRRPSTVVGATTPATRPETPIITPQLVSSARRLEPGKLRRRLAGDLDNIVLMALRKERSQRYASVAELADDIDRYLHSRPVRARSATFWYRTSTFVRRNRIGVGAVALVVVSLLVGLIGVTWQAKLTGEQRDLADGRFEDIRELAHSLLFDVHDEIRDMPGATAARKRLIVRAKAYLDTLLAEVGDDPELLLDLAHCYERLGDVQSDVAGANLGETASALESQRKALAIRRQLFAMTPDDSYSRKALAVSLQRNGDMLRLRGELESARQYYQESEDIVLDLVEDDPDEVEPARMLMVAYLKTGIAHTMQGSFEKARSSYDAALQIGEAAAARNPDDRALKRTLAVAIEKIGDDHQVNGDAETALVRYQDVKAMYQSLLDGEPTSVSFKMSLAIIVSKIGEVLGHPSYSNVGDPDGALQAFIESRDLLRELRDHDPDDANAQHALCVLLRRIGDMHGEAGRWEVALGVFESACDIAREEVRDDPESITGRGDLATSLFGIAESRLRGDELDAARGKFQEALSIQEDVWQQAETYVRAKEGIATCTLGIARTYRRASEMDDSSANRIGQLSSAIEWFERALKHFRDLKAAGSLVVAYEKYLAGIPERIAQCEDALAELGIERPNRAGGIEGQ